MTEKIIDTLRALADPAQVPGLSRFFKTGPGQYGEGDVFWGVRVPQQREVVRKFKRSLSIQDLGPLLDSPVHECRLTGLLLLVEIFQRGGEERSKAMEFYEANLSRVNNWDLVDSSAPYITGPWYFDRDRTRLYLWAQSSHLWTQRIAIMSTFYFIRQMDFATTLELAETLLHHPHDLIHKSVGWMLREVGNRDRSVEESFLQEVVHGQPRYLQMPRTMLRYAIEKFPRELYRKYLEK